MENENKRDEFIICPECKNKYDAQTEFCTFCGHSICEDGVDQHKGVETLSDKLERAYRIAYCGEKPTEIPKEKEIRESATNKDRNLTELDDYPPLVLLRKGLLTLFESNKILNFILSIAPLLMLAYPIFSVLCAFSGSGDSAGITNGVLSVAFIFGGLCCLALGQKNFLMVSFGLMALAPILEFMQQSYITPEQLIYVLFYIFLAIFSYGVDTRPLASRTVKFPLKAFVIIIVLIILVVLIIGFIDSIHTCTKCGEIFTKGYNLYGEYLCEECFWG